MELFTDGVNQMLSYFEIKLEHICFYTHYWSIAVRFSRRTKNPTASFYHAFLGKYQKDEDNVDQGQLRVDFEWIRIHDNYNHDTTDHDIAVIRVSDFAPWHFGTSLKLH